MERTGTTEEDMSSATLGNEDKMIITDEEDEKDEKDSLSDAGIVGSSRSEEIDERGEEVNSDVTSTRERDQKQELNEESISHIQSTAAPMNRSISLQVHASEYADDVSDEEVQKSSNDGNEEFEITSPFLYFTHALREERNRAKICFAFGNCMQDISSIEEVYGKQILKIGSQNQAKEEWPVVPNKLWHQIGTTMERLGKQHIGFHLCVTQSIVRELHTTGSSIDKKTHKLEAEIQELVLALKRKNNVFKKLYQKYTKLVKDAELSIKAREEAFLQYASRAHRNDRGENFQDVSSYLNRGFSKMISKIIPTDDFKTIHDRCRSLMGEIEDIEVNLTEQSDRLNEMHEKLHNTASGMTEQLELLEDERLQNTKDGLLRFCQASEGMLEHNKKILDDLRGLTMAAAAEGVNFTGVFRVDKSVDSAQKCPEDILALEMEIALMVKILRDAEDSNERNLGDTACMNSSNQSINDVASVLSEDKDDDCLKENQCSSLDLELNIEIHLQSIEKLKNALLALGNLHNQTTVFFSEVAEVEQNFCTLAVKLFERNGYKYSNSAGNVVVASSNANLQSHSSNQVSHNDMKSTRALISDYESPLSRVVWDSLIRAVENFTEAHSTSSELLLQQCSVSTDEAQRKIQSYCQEKSINVLHFTKELNALKSEKSRLSSKLRRVRKEINDHKMNSPSSSSNNSDRNYLRHQVLLNEEESLLQQFASVAKNFDLLTEECASSLEAEVVSFKQEIQEHLEGIIISYQEFLDSNNIKVNIWQRAIRKVRDDVEKINIEEDRNFYRERVQCRYSHHLENISNVDEDIGLPKKKLFCPIVNDVVDIERSNERDSMMQEDVQRPLSPSSELSGGQKVLGSIIGGIKAGSSQFIEGVSRGRKMTRKDESKRRSLSAGDEKNQKDLEEVNEKYQDRRRHSLKLSSKQSDEVHENDNLPMDIIAETSVSRETPGENNVIKLKSAISVESEPTGELLKTSNSIDVCDDLNSTNNIDISESSNDTIEDEGEAACDEDVSKLEVSDVSNFKLPEPAKEMPVVDNPELAKFGIADEKIITHFSCALIPKRGLLTHGRIFITKNHVAFSGWPELRVLIPLASVERLKKTNTVYIIPNAITVYTVDEGRYLFGSFIDRDHCFEILSSMVNIARSLVQVMNPDSLPESIKKNTVDDTIGAERRVDVSASSCGHDEGQLEQGGRVVVGGAHQHLIQFDHILNFQEIFDKCSITKLRDFHLEATSTDIWRIGWLKCCGYRQFLESEGDLEIDISEWEVFGEKIEKDTSLLNFQFRRTCTYLHPRTSMLMFGPKNATARQVQYLHIPEWSNKDPSFLSVDKLEALHPVSNALVMTTTQFEGIPMADVFKVYMYWTFEAVCTEEEERDKGKGEASASLCRIQTGLRVEYLKMSLIKSQIFAGTKEELEVLSKQWEQYLMGKLRKECSGLIKAPHPRRRRKRKKARLPPHQVTFNRIMDYESLFNSSSVTKLHEGQLNGTSSILWKVGWLKCAGYRNFLESEGDLEIVISEWEVFDKEVDDDTSQLKFQFRRTCTYLHPRTSMLMFGPKNATARQVQYLHIPEWSDKDPSFLSVDKLETLHPVSNALVMTTTQFEGIPMADVFKVYMYWTFEAVCTEEEERDKGKGEASASLCRIQTGLRVEYLKSTLLKSQIFAGTKEELEVLSKQWELFINVAIQAEYKRQEAIMLSENGDDLFYSDSEVSDDTDEEIDNIRLKQSKHAHVARTIPNATPGASQSGQFWLVLIIGLLSVQFLILALLYWKLSQLEMVLERLNANIVTMPSK